MALRAVSVWIRMRRLPFIVMPTGEEYPVPAAGVPAGQARLRVVLPTAAPTPLPLRKMRLSSTSGELENAYGGRLRFSAVFHRTAPFVLLKQYSLPPSSKV